MSFRKNSQHMLVLRERKTMFTQSIPLDSKRALSTATALIALMEKIPVNARRSLTLGNGGGVRWPRVLVQGNGVAFFLLRSLCVLAKGRR